MKVYAACHHDYDHFSVMAVYDTEAKAEKHIADLTPNWSAGTEGEVYVYLGPQFLDCCVESKVKKLLAEYDRSENFSVFEWDVE